MHKVARDLGDELEEHTMPKRRWSRHVGGHKTVQAVIVSDAKDPEMGALRAHIERLGGSVLAVHGLVRAMTVQIKARHVRQLAQRDDVVSISPNRETRRTASTLESITGSLTSQVRTNSSKTSYSGLDGSGVGIAVLDSGVMRNHLAFNDAAGAKRIKRHVEHAQHQRCSRGPAATAAIRCSQAVPRSPATRRRSTTPAATCRTATATARTWPRSPPARPASTPDPRPMPPAWRRTPNLYDVKVLGDDGSGTLSDALEGIIWVIYHAKEYNIRVMNLSLAADSTESWQTDPLCIAVRTAAAAGITVVAAAGNFGLDAQRQPRSTAASARPASTRR